MGDVLFLALRRLRTPLIALILAYAFSVVGLVAIPGADPAGNPYHLGFFHAFYVVSYTATTIGFGEIPFAFTDAQRAWVTFSIYLSVTCWAFTLGSVIALAQDQAFRAAFARSRFRNRVERLEEAYFLLLGYGQSNAALAHALDDLGFRTVVVETRPDRARHIEIEGFQQPPLVLVGDARWPDVLQDAGVRGPHCKAVVIQVGDDEVAQAIAIGVSVLQPGRYTLARVHSEEACTNLDPFPHITVIDPFETFATNLALALASPAVLWAEEWLTGVPGGACPHALNVPEGHWVVLGYGRFGHSVGHALERAGATWTAVDSDRHAAQDSHLHKDDNSERALVEAGIENAVGIVACTNRDAINLAIVSRARRLKPSLFVAIRQNHVADRALIEAARADMQFVKADVMVHECLQLLVTPLLNRFLMRVRERGKDCAEQLIVSLLTKLDERVPSVWTFDCDVSQPGLRDVLGPDTQPPLSLADLLVNPLSPPEKLRAVPLMVLRGNEEFVLPETGMQLHAGDQILMAGASGVEALQRRFLLDPSPLGFVRTGIEPARSWLFRWIAARRQPSA
ncbi:NAD-binding protein [Uliginosibacterium sp. H1]|uniref:NAD-binding protein n=1 Tax=Uliginosibacterium sp. H1 TaxID=3114757 RepID=UPI002E16EBC9|nr:NAD-binding protein [Uliginosibacterium sp. H1]